MNRQDIITFCNNEIFPKIDIEQAFFMDCKEVIKKVIRYRRENGYPKMMQADVIDGDLFINDLFVGRIAPKKRKPAYDEQAYYIEGLILSRQEAQFD